MIEDSSYYRISDLEHEVSGLRRQVNHLEEELVKWREWALQQAAKAVETMAKS